MRVTGTMVYDQVLGDIRASQTHLAGLQEQLASGRRINRPSDDPAGVQHVLGLSHALGQNERYQTTAKDGADRLNAIDQALASLGEIVTRARQLVLQGANSGLPQDAWNALVTELTSLRAQVVDTANAQQADSYLFGGTQDGTKPWSVDPLGNLVYSGDTNVIMREIGPGIRVAASVDASTEIQNLYGAITQSITDMQAGNVGALGTTDLQALTDAQSGILDRRAQAGALAARMQLASDRLSAANISLQEMRSNVLDVYIAKAALDATQSQFTYRLALQVGAQLLQPTLLDFLR